ncbi:hypothetical protein ILUMI_02578 [Ignelater luminosus]|uniref:Myb/SANT-like DNA-binding domain-containing protein n=1 Tax=Ignelater luminosus TaxID=2038154 RepID=A0A8K0DI22_IGNLU|nr:hypothetical protein ILUMI_02578 [Ignelater luminosus]
MNCENKSNLTIFDLESVVSYNLCLTDEELARAHKVTNSQRAALSASIEQAADTSQTNKVEDYTTKINQLIWQYNQVVDLIKSMSTHVDDLNHPKKRKQVFENVVNDLIGLKYEVSAIMVQNKWNSLVKSYRKTKDSKTRTERSPSRFNLYELMDEILGANPTNSSI